jgi:uncharacterized protein (TIGR02117 family)
MPLRRKILRVLKFVSLTLFAFVFSYLACAHSALLFPANAALSVANSASEPGVDIWVLSNGVHTDIVLPLAPMRGATQVVADQNALNQAPNWRTMLPPAIATDAFDAIAIGWGDREFYLNTPSWAELKISTAARALFAQNASLVHVQYLTRAQLKGAITLRLSAANYQRLAQFILRTAALKNGVGHSIGAHYNDDDAFFEANGAYSAFNTCNSWTGRALRTAGVKVSRWTPFPWLVTWYLPRA